MYIKSEFEKIKLNHELNKLKKYMTERKENPDKYYLPIKFVEKVRENAKKYPSLIKNYLEQISYVDKIDGKLPKEAGKMLEELCFSDDYVVGRHIGTLTGKQMAENNFNFRYDDNSITSTVVLNKSLSSGMESFLLSDLVHSCHSKESIGSYKNGNSVTIFAFPKKIFNEEILPIWFYDIDSKKYYLIPQFILGSFSYDYEKNEIAFYRNPNFNPNLKYEIDGLSYDENQEDYVKKNSFKM